MEKINIAELLKDCPKGMELDCTLFEGVVFHDIVNRHFPIRVRREQGGLIELTANGCIKDKIDAKCVIFPKGKTTWEGFRRPFKDGDVIVCENHWGPFISIFKENVTERNGFIGYCVLDVDDNEFKIKDSASYFNKARFATKREKEQLFRAIERNGYKWNEKTKTLEKLSPNKFDITTLKPYDKVLVRDFDNTPWEIEFFSRLLDGKHFKCLDVSYTQCIPYEGNEHLLGKTDDCDEYFKTWK